VHIKHTYGRMLRKRGPPSPMFRRPIPLNSCGYRKYWHDRHDLKIVFDGFTKQPAAVRGSATPAILRWTVNAREVICGVDQRDMAECLGKVAEHTPASGIVFLGQQADIVAQFQ
jgi:hypothetical protein